MSRDTKDEDENSEGYGVGRKEKTQEPYANKLNFTPDLESSFDVGIACCFYSWGCGEGGREAVEAYTITTYYISIRKMRHKWSGNGAGSTLGASTTYGNVFCSVDCDTHGNVFCSMNCDTHGRLHYAE